MTKPQLTVERLLQSGFDEVGCWELNSARDLSHSIDLPTKAGVYAFAINGVVQYVGLASKSLRQRLGFYRNPAASQRTNVRLNETIRRELGNGSTVQVLTAHPPDHAWNALLIKGAEGLEARLIECFELPWNIRGSQTRTAAPSSRLSNSKHPRSGALADKIVQAVRTRHGMTELEIAKKIYGPGAVQQQVNQYCRRLVGKGLLERRGRGGPSDPYTYFAEAS